MSASPLSQTTQSSLSYLRASDQSLEGCNYEIKCKSSKTTIMSEDHPSLDQSSENIENQERPKPDIKDFDGEAKKPSTKRKITVSELLLRVLESQQLIKNQNQSSTKTGLSNKGNMSLFSSPLPGENSWRSQAIHKIKHLVEGISKVCLLKTSKKCFQVEARGWISGLHKTLGLIQGPILGSPFANFPVSSSIDYDDLRLKVKKPMYEVVYYFRNLTEQILDFSHLSEAGRPMTDHRLKFQNLDKETFNTLFNSIGINSLESIFTLFKNAGPLNQDNSENGYRSPVISLLKETVLSKIALLNMDLDLHCRVVSLLIAVAQLHVEMASWCINSLSEVDVKSRTSGELTRLEQTFANEVVCGRLFTKQIWNRFTHEVGPVLEDSIPPWHAEAGEKHHQEIFGLRF